MLPAVPAKTSASLETLTHIVERVQKPMSLVKISGRVTSVTGSGITVRGLSPIAKVGDFVRLSSDSRSALAEVLSINAGEMSVKSLDSTAGFQIGCRAEFVGPLGFAPCDGWRGRVISALAEPLDGAGALPQGDHEVTVTGQPPLSMERGVVSEKVTTGVKAVDIFTPICLGQRVGIFAGSGVGKSTLMSMLAQAPGFDTAVIALVGERGREVSEFVHETLGPAIKKSVVIVSTSDESAGRRKMVPLLATAVAEHFRDKGQQVLLIMDSVTRYAHALRELALASGEPPVARGYPPSVFGLLPQLLERAGPGKLGSGAITAFYAVLVDGDNHNEPVADTLRGILDGHIVLSRNIAASGRYPAVDLLSSISRLSGKAWSPEERKAAQDMRKLVSRFEETKDLRALGGYQAGADIELDRAIAFVPKLYGALNQSASDPFCDDPFGQVARMTKPPGSA